MTRIMVCISPKFVIYVAYRLRCVWAAALTGESPLKLRRAELRTQGILNVAELAAQPSGKIVKAASSMVVLPSLPIEYDASSKRIHSFFLAPTQRGVSRYGRLCQFTS
jgi:hypothetical protein